MESELGTRLFLRQQRDVSLTEAGAALQIEAEATVRQFEFAQRNAQRAGRGDIGHIELGYVASAVFCGLLQKQVQAFSRACPDVSLNVRESPMDTLRGWLWCSMVDSTWVTSCCSTNGALPEGLDAIRLDAEGFVLALSAEAWLCRLPDIGPQHLQDETFILPEQISGTLQRGRRGRILADTLGAQPGRVGGGNLPWWSLGQWAWQSCRNRWSATSVWARCAVSHHQGLCGNVVAVTDLSPLSKSRRRWRGTSSRSKKPEATTLDLQCSDAFSGASLRRDSVLPGALSTVTF